MSTLSANEFLLLSTENTVDVREIDVSRNPNKNSRIVEFYDKIGGTACFKVGKVILKPKYRRAKPLDNHVCNIMEQRLNRM